MGDGRRVVAGEARVAEPAVGPDGLLQVLDADVGQRVGAEDLGHLLDGVVGRQQLLVRRGVDPVEAGPAPRGRRDAQVDLGRAGLAQHADDRALGRPAHDGVVHHHQPLAGDGVGERVQLAPHRVGPRPLVGRDEGAADVAVLHQALAVGDAAGAGEALGGGDPRLGHAHHHVGLGGRLGRQQLAHAAPGLVDLPAVEAAVGTRDVGELEDAEPRLDLAQPGNLEARGPVGVDHDELAGRDLAHEGGADHAEGRRLGGQHPALGGVGRAEPAQAQGAEAVRVAHAEEPLGAHDDEGERALQDGEHQLQRRGEVLGLGEGVHQELGDDVAVGADRPRQHPDLLGQGAGVGQVAVVPEREAGPPHRPVDRLGARPVRGAVRRVAGVPDGEMPVEPREGALVEDGRHQTHVLDDGDGVAVAHRHAGRLLAPVLQGEEAIEREVGHPHPGRVDPEDTARFLHAVTILAQGGVMHPPGPGPGSAPPRPPRPRREGPPVRRGARGRHPPGRGRRRGCRRRRPGRTARRGRASPPRSGRAVR